MTAPETQAARLVRWYPRVWRDRYGAEFTELLRAELEEQPRSWRRNLDVRHHGAKARLAAIGIGAGPVRDLDSIRALGAFALAGFLAGALSLWGQILGGSSSAPYVHPPVAAIRLVFAVTFAGLVLVGVARLRTLVRHAAAVGARRLVAPLLLIGLGVVLFGGGLVVVWSDLHSRITPTSVMNVMALSINTFWVHPHVLVRRYDRTTLAWMALSPVAIAMVVAGLVGLVRRTRHLVQPPESAGLSGAWRVALLVPVLGVSAWWVIGSQHDRSPIVRAGTLDLALIAAMAGALALLATTSRASQNAI